MTFLVLADTYERAARYLAERGFRCGMGSIWRRRRGKDRAFILARPEDLRGWDPEDTRVVRMAGWYRRNDHEQWDWAEGLGFARYSVADEVPD